MDKPPKNPMSAPEFQRRVEKLKHKQLLPMGAACSDSDEMLVLVTALMTTAVDLLEEMKWTQEEVEEKILTAIYVRVPNTEGGKIH